MVLLVVADEMRKDAKEVMARVLYLFRPSTY